MKEALYSFLQAKWDGRSPLLVGFSGGPDSQALLHMLLEEKRLPLKIGLAHIDHGWRKSSHQEAELLACFAKAHKLPFHLKKLQPDELKGNLESACRTERRQFFAAVAKEFGYQAVLLAHHADDQAETVLKKLFESVPLALLTGLLPESTCDHLPIWRPLLGVQKSALLEFLQVRSIQAFDDETNRDTRFLRARFRQKLFPFTQQLFGKNISSALCGLGKEAAELNAYLSKQIAPYLRLVKKGPFGVLLDLSAEGLPQRVELKHLMRLFCSKNEFALSQAALESLLSLLQQGCANKKIQSGRAQLFVDRRRIFLLKDFPTLPAKPCILPEGSFAYGPWQGHVETIPFKPVQKSSSWPTLCQGDMHVLLPLGKYALIPPCGHMLYPGASAISKWWSAQKVPVFLRSLAPIVCQVNADGCPGVAKHEFLTGRSHFSFEPKQKVLNLVLKRNI